ncbi:MAG: acyl carrier protein [Acidobacteriota bacterium]|nr:acyl carrier protein [Acidobacteriota bacterium]
MDDSELRQVIVAALRKIAPEIGDDELDDHRPLRRQVDLDSIDWLRFLVELHERLQVDIPETDYPQLSSVADLVGYLRTRV